MSKGKKVGLAVGMLVAAAAVGAFLFIQQRNRAPSGQLVHDQVEKLVATPQVKVTSVTSTITPTTPAHASVAYQAEAQVSEALYEPADVAALLRDELKLDPETWMKTRKSLSGKTAPRILELAGLKGTDPTLMQATLLHVATPAGTKLSFTGTFAAEKTAEGWQLQGGELNRVTGETRGQPRSAFSGSTLVVDDAGDMKKLRDAAAAQAAVPAKIEQARVAFVKEREAQQEKIIAELLGTIKAGTVYSGTVTIGSEPPAKIFLEFTNLNPRSRQVLAVLRNDGGWADKRAAKGSYLFDPDAETLTVLLETNSNQAIPDGGPILSERESWRVPFLLNGAKLTARDQRRDFTLTRLSEADAAAARKTVEADSLALREATQAGRIYRGIVRNRDGSQGANHLLRFNQQDAEAGTVVASLEPDGRENWRRTYRGAVAMNRYRAQGGPLKIESGANDAVKVAEKTSPVGAPTESVVSLKLADGHLRGDSADFSYDFAPLSAAEIAKMEAAAAEREKALLAIVKSGTAYPGTARLEAKTTTTEKVRLRFREVSAHGLEVDAIMESLERPGVYRDLHGTVDSHEKRLVLNVTGKGRTNAASRAGLKFPPLRSSAEQVITLEIGATSLTGETKDWKMSFPVAGAVAVTGNSTGDYPAETGAYVWSGGGWVPLPRNNGKVTKSGGGSGLKAIGGLFSALTNQSQPATSNEKFGDLSFTGSDSVPAVDGRAVTVIYVGSISDDLQEKYSQAKYPEIEMGATTRESDGSRKIPLMKIASNLSNGGFRDRRVLAVVERVNDTVVEMSATRTLPAGTYAVGVNEDAFELNVQ
ncbi:MAG: hypothetical protein JWM32_1913 [Verrucomicrobia bacterium]|nr:hypothetical protein [Verrucomicrobiota bacterium]